MKKSEDLVSMHDAFVDSQLRSMEYHAMMVLQLWDKMEDVQPILLSGGVGSPRFKSADEAFYLKSEPYIENSRVVEALLEEEDLLDRYRYHCREMHRIGEALSVLSEEELELLHRYYEVKLPASFIAGLEGYEKKYILRKLQKIRGKVVIS